MACQLALFLNLSRYSYNGRGGYLVPSHLLWFKSTPDQIARAIPTIWKQGWILIADIWYSEFWLQIADWCSPTSCASTVYPPTSCDSKVHLSSTSYLSCDSHNLKTGLTTPRPFCSPPVELSEKKKANCYQITLKSEWPSTHAPGTLCE